MAGLRELRLEGRERADKKCDATAAHVCAPPFFAHQ
jgi:hypothetical protein